eukprot:358735-Chlamydomonas_euryale.AAC.4
MPIGGLDIMPIPGGPPIGIGMPGGGPPWNCIGGIPGGWGPPGPPPGGPGKLGKPPVGCPDMMKMPRAQAALSADLGTAASRAVVWGCGYMKTGSRMGQLADRGTLQPAACGVRHALNLVRAASC